MKTFKISMLLCLILFIGCKEQKTLSVLEKSDNWFKGNLHTHSYWSDGDEFPEVILDWYKSQGYNFAALSDHNILADHEKWITIKDDQLYQRAFKNYLDVYGDEWVEHKIDSGKTIVKLKSFQEYKGLTEEKGQFLVIPSEEITDSYENNPIHINATNVQEKIEPMGGNSVASVMQNNIDQVLAQRKKTGIPIIPHINHPNFFYGITLEDMISLNGERFFEVYNGHHMVQNMGDSIHISTEEMWDMINIAYLKNGKPLMYGLATDDSHNYHRKGREWSNAGRGWVMVRADTLSARSLINAMEAGNFYSTTGVELDEVILEGGKLSIVVKEKPGISYQISFIGSKVGDVDAQEFSTIQGSQASFEITDDILFVRCKITSTKLQDNSIEDILYEMAWTQPVTNRN